MAIQEEKKPRGRPKYIPNDNDLKKVKILAIAGLPRRRIAAVIGIGEHTLSAHYKKEIDTAREEANGAVLSNLFRLASRGDNPVAAIFWCKTQLRWRETDRLELEHSGEIAHKHLTPEIKPLTLDEWQERFAKPQVH